MVFKAFESRIFLKMKQWEQPEQSQQSTSYDKYDFLNLDIKLNTSRKPSSDSDIPLFTSKETGTGLKILTPKQMLQILQIAPAQVKAGNNSESLLSEIRQVVYYLYQSKEITKKVYSNIIKSTQM